MAYVWRWIEMNEFLNKINWPLLANQKLALLTTIGRAEHDDNDLALVPAQMQEYLSGLVNLIDVLQDFADDQEISVVWLEEKE